MNNIRCAQGYFGHLWDPSYFCVRCKITGVRGRHNGETWEADQFLFEEHELALLAGQPDPRGFRRQPLPS